MARPRKPTAVLDLTGRLKHDKKRFRDQGRDSEPQDDRPLGDPPESLDEAERARWIELANDMPWLRRADRVTLEMAAKQYAVLRKSGGRASDYAVFKGFLTELGATPASRSKVKVPGSKPKPANAFGSLTG